MPDQPGPLKCLLDQEKFDEVHLLSDHSAAKNRHYLKWLGGDPVLHAVKLTNPTDYPEVFKVVDAELASVVSVPRPHALDLCVHLSPGTPTMTAIWLLLGKSKYHPATFYQTHEGKAWVTSIPFDLVVDFVPQVLAGRRRPASATRQPKPARCRGLRGHRRRQPQSSGCGGAGTPGSTSGCVGASPRRERHRQGEVRQGDPRRQPPQGQEVRLDQLRRHLQGTAGVRTFRPQERCVYRGRSGSGSGRSKRPMAARFSWTRSANATRQCRPNCCESSNRPTTTPAIGSSTGSANRSPSTSDVRIIAATNRDLNAAIAKGEFRDDLYYRVAAITIKLPPLRERREDIPLLVQRLLGQINENFEKKEPGYRHKTFSSSAMTFVRKHPWPGNVRQLYNTLLQAAVMTDGDVIDRQDVADAIAEVPGKPTVDLMEQPLGEGFVLTDFLEEIQRHYLLRGMKEAGGVKTKAAELLGYKNYQTLAAQLERLKVEVPEY